MDTVIAGTAIRSKPDDEEELEDTTHAEDDREKPEPEKLTTSPPPEATTNGNDADTDGAESTDRTIVSPNASEPA